MSLKRALILGVAALAACDPTGIIPVTPGAASLRLANVVVEQLSPDILIRGNTGRWAPHLVS